MERQSIRKQTSIFAILLLLCLTCVLNVTTAFAAGTGKKTMNVGDKIQLTVTNTNKTIKWSSSNKAVATVNKKGLVTAKKAGTVVITAKFGSKKLKYQIKVKKNSEVADVISIVNKNRKKYGLPDLKENALLAKAASVRAKELAQYFSHTRPNGTSCFTAISSAYDYRALGENIAYGYSSADSVMVGWMNSPGHRANILNSNFTEIGVGLYEYNGTKYWVQMFGSQW